MRSLSDLTSADRILIVAPHPDDESLAAGGLIQRAVAAGARVRVLFASNGDQNPWPQRVWERRLRIGSEDGWRWGKLRRGEALRALAVLGVPEAEARFLEFPDQGFTSALLRGQQPLLEAIACQLREFVPTWLVAPSPGDRHPDHSALAVMVALAVRRSDLTPEVLHYVIHQPRQASGLPGEALALSAREQEVKREAILTHRSQMLLSRRRFLRFAGPQETFFRSAFPGEPHGLSVSSSAGSLRIACESELAASMGGKLLLVSGDASSALRWEIDLPPHSRSVPVRDVAAGEVVGFARVRRFAGRIEVRISGRGLPPGGTVFLRFGAPGAPAAWREIQVQLKSASPSPPEVRPGFAPAGRLSFAWTLAAIVPLLALAAFFAQDFFRPWTDIVDYNGAVWSQAAHNILRAGLLSTVGASSGFYFGPLPIPPSGYYLHHPPLLHLSLTFLFHLFGEHEWVARLLPIAASLGTAVLLWLLVAHCSDRRTATFSVFLFACMPMELHYGQMVNFEPVVLLLIMAGLLGLRYWHASGAERWKWLALAAFLAGLWVDWAMYIFVLVLCAYWFSRPDPRTRRLAWFLLACCLAFGVLYLIRIQILRPDAWHDLTHTFFKRLGGSQSNVRFTEFQWLQRIGGNLTTEYLPVAWLLALIGAIILFRPRQQRPGLKFLRLSCLLIAVTDLIFVGAFQNDSYIHRYIAFYFLVPVAILAGVALSQAVDWLRGWSSASRPLRGLATAAFCAALALGAFSGLSAAARLKTQFRILDIRAAEPGDLIPDLGEAIQQHFPPDTQILCNFLPSYGPQLGYYAQRTLLNNLADFSSWEPHLATRRDLRLGGIIWLNSHQAEDIVAHLPPGTKDFLKIDDVPFCVWKPVTAASAPPAKAFKTLKSLPGNSSLRG